MTLSSEAKKPAAAAKTKPPVTLKHLAAALAEEHQLTKRAGEALLGGFVGSITKHLKKGDRIRIAGLGIPQVRKRARRVEARTKLGAHVGRVHRNSLTTASPFGAWLHKTCQENLAGVYQCLST
jgi:DNA-binding protein HU-beta